MKKIVIYFLIAIVLFFADILYASPPVLSSGNSYASLSLAEPSAGDVEVSYTILNSTDVSGILIQRSADVSVIPTFSEYGFFVLILLLLICGALRISSGKIVKGFLTIVMIILVYSALGIAASSAWTNITNITAIQSSSYTDYGLSSSVYYYRIGITTSAGTFFTDSAEITVTDSGDVACGNDTGNGDEIISGPSTTDENDHDSVFRSLTVHPTNPNTLWMGTERNGFVKSTNGGTTWARYRFGLRHTNDLYPEIWDIAVSPGNPDILLAATLDSPGPVRGSFPSSIGGIYKSTDGGETWVRKNCGLENSRIESIQIHASNSDIAIAGVGAGTASFSQLQNHFFYGGIYLTTDGGENWSKVETGAEDDQSSFWHIKRRGTDPSTFVTFGFNSDDLSASPGLLISSDSGSNWTTFGDALKNLYISNFDLSGDGTVIYANERDSFVMQKSTNSGSNWSETSIIQANGPVAVSPDDSQIVLFGGTATLYRSTDGLQTTSEVLSASASIEDVVFAPSDSNTVYVGATGYLIYKSTDAGKTFTLIKNIRTDVL